MAVFASGFSSGWQWSIEGDHVGVHKQGMESSRGCFTEKISPRIATVRGIRNVHVSEQQGVSCEPWAIQQGEIARAPVVSPILQGQHVICTDVFLGFQLSQLLVAE